MKRLILETVLALLLVAGGWRTLAWAGPQFGLGDLDGRYVNSAHADDISSINGETSGDIDPSIPFVTADVMIADGGGRVCGQTDGFYAAGTAGKAPGVNLGPNTFHGTYTVDATTGRVEIDTCGDSGPFCGVSTACSPVTKIQVGYLGNKGLLPTVEQCKSTSGSGPQPKNVSCGSDSSGFLVHNRVWVKQVGENNGDKNNGDKGGD